MASSSHLQTLNKLYNRLEPLYFDINFCYNIMMNLILNILRTIPLFQALSESEHKTIIEHVNMEYFPAHHTLFKEGVMGESMYIIKSGMLRIFNATGELAQLGEGDFFGEMALIEDKPRMASAETLSDCEIFLLKKEDFAELMQKSPDIAEKVQLAYLDRKNKNKVQ
jgi:CRP/FNR family cyclic AMP-dependent transcriptional regulator